MGRFFNLLNDNNILFIIHGYDIPTSLIPKIDINYILEKKMYRDKQVVVI